MLDQVTQDLRLALRTLRRRPGFTAAAIATLALGIGASTAIFSVAYGVSWRPLPYPEADRLVRIYEANTATVQLRHDVSGAAFHAWREGSASIESAALFGKSGTRYLARGADEDRRVTTMSVSPAFFDVIGVKPLLGPGFRPERDYTRYTADEEAVLSYGAWQRLFGGRRDVIGQSLEFTGVGDNDFYRIVGVMPRDFVFHEPVDVWRPANIVPAPIPRIFRIWRYDRVVARLRPGATIDRARAELETVAARLAREFPASNGGWTVTVESLHDATIGGFGRATWLLLAAVAVVLLVTCLNVGGLLAARAVARERETAVRVALGAGSWRLARLWLAEASMVSGGGAALGLLVAASAVSALKAAAPPGIPRLDAIQLDLPAVGVAIAATLVGVVIVTLAPLRAATRSGTQASQGLADALRGAPGAGEARGRTRLRAALTITQCAGAATLVVLAVMLTRSFVRLTSIDFGWDAAGVLSLNVSPQMPPQLRRPWYRYVEWSDRLIARLEAAPGIAGAAVATQVPLSPQSNPNTLARGRGRTAADAARWPGVPHSVTDGYFAMMGIRVVRGRAFTATDRFTEAQMTGAEKVERGVAIVSASTARALWPGRDAIGEAMWLPDIDNVTWREVVGVVEDIQFHGVGEAPALHVFVPWTQYSTGRPRLLVKASSAGAGSAAAIAPLVRSIARETDPGAHVDQVVPLDTLIANATAQPRFTTRAVAAFGALALTLAAIGIYGTLSYLVAARTREIGIRLALGAPQGGIVRTILWRGLVPAIGGGGAGLALALALARTFRALLFQIEPLDLRSFAGGAALLLLVALAASAGPAYRASRVDPSRSLRAE